MRRADVDVVIPTIGRPSLDALLRALAVAVAAAAAEGLPRPRRILVVDDRRQPAAPLALEVPGALTGLVEVRTAGGRGPAAARNAGWRAARAEWVAFLDDDVLVAPTWLVDLHRDLAACDADVAASQARLRVPRPADRRATDWERTVAGLEVAVWATADMAYRRRALLDVDGFDERFGRAYREDADLGLRVTAAGWRIARGERTTTHPVRPADDAVSVRLQAGNAEDPFMRAVHGPRWRERAAVPRGRRPAHLATTASGAAGVALLVLRHRRMAVGSLAAWAGLTADFAWQRIAPGPRSRDEVIRMLWTSAAIPPAATWHWLRGVASLPARLRRPGPHPETVAEPVRWLTPVTPGGDDPPSHAGAVSPPAAGPRAGAVEGAAQGEVEGAGEDGVLLAVLFDRDGTLVHDVPHNGDPDRVRPVEGARSALDRLRAAGLRLGVVTNQGSVAEGRLTTAEVAAVNARVEALLGPFDTWAVCHHGPDEGCGCRKPAPGLVRRAAAALGVPVTACAVVGDIGADVEAALAAGARAVLVPTDVTLPEEVAAAPEVARDLAEAVDLLLGGDRERGLVVALLQPALRWVGT